MTAKRTWKQKIGKRALAHIAETTQRGTLTEFKKNLAAQRQNPADHCWECNRIAEKLGL